MHNTLYALRILCMLYVLGPLNFVALLSTVGHTGEFTHIFYPCTLTNGAYCITSAVGKTLAYCVARL